MEYKCHVCEGVFAWGSPRYILPVSRLIRHLAMRASLVGRMGSKLARQ